jgi:dTDP-glucose 4,6-dehydratase
MKYFITGGLGFIGYNFLLQELEDSKSVIINVDKDSYYSNKRPIASDNYFLYKYDIGDSKKISELLALHQPDYVLNFAAETHVDRSIHSPAGFVQTNVQATFNLLEEVRHYFDALKGENKEKFRFLHVSTDEVFGSLEIGDKTLFNEQTRYDPSSPYSATKAASDHLVRAWHKTYGLPTIITNCSNNYGPFQYAEKLIPFMIVKAIRNEKMPIYGSGENIRDWLFVTDHCEAIKLALIKGNAGETYCVGGGAERTNIEVVETICNVLDEVRPRIDGLSYKNQISFVQDRLGHDKRYAVDFSKISNNLGWQPKNTFDLGIKRTVLWYLENFDWLEKSMDNKEFSSWCKQNYQLNNGKSE